MRLSFALCLGILLVGALCSTSTAAHRLKPSYEKPPASACININDWTWNEVEEWTIQTCERLQPRPTWWGSLDISSSSPTQRVSSSIISKLNNGRRSPSSICIMDRSFLRREWVSVFVDELGHEIDKCCGHREFYREVGFKALHLLAPVMSAGLSTAPAIISTVRVAWWFVAAVGCAANLVSTVVKSFRSEPIIAVMLDTFVLYGHMDRWYVSPFLAVGLVAFILAFGFLAVIHYKTSDVGDRKISLAICFGFAVILFVTLHFNFLSSGLLWTVALLISVWQLSVEATFLPRACCLWIRVLSLFRRNDAR